MVFRKKIVQSLIIALVLFTPLVVKALSVNEIFKLNPNGSGFLNIVYWEKESVVKEKNFVVGNFPFSKEKSEQYFNSGGTELKSFVIGKNEKDNSFTEIKALIYFKDINKITELKALSNLTISLVEKNAENIFTYTIPPEYSKNNSVENLYVIINYEGNILSSNGKIDKKSVTWFRSKEYLNANKTVALTANFEATKKTDNTSTSNGKEKSCGLFGLELPLILLLGLTLTGKFRKHNS